MKNHSVRLRGVEFANPVLAASGTWEFGLRFKAVSARLGGVVTKGITVEPRAGNPGPRIFEFPGGILNSVGLENPGLERFRDEVLPEVAALGTRVIVNVAGFEPGEFDRLVGELDREPVAGFELNLSCPNVGHGGAAFGQDPKLVEDITRRARARTDRPVVVKLTANFTDPVATARAAEAGGADAVTVINTLFGLALNANGRPFLGGRNGGMSGPALKPFALYCVDRVAAAVGIPVIGCGGIMDGRDALDFLSAGAALVQVGTASLVEPDAAARVWTGLRRLCRDLGAESWADIVGRTRRED
ncbi:dihydroorotate dehydrogenase [candidate division WOR-3 bacterium]|nr:dihydroorotate dehydrogenase [candidate division WOR-3 bacterium]